jgi:4-amino-4-deoxy-L-arabinose transferase-like glycosyltransferase
MYRVSQLPLSEWDESRNVMNAYEMVKSGNWIAMTFDGSLDHWNLKPPLFIWILAAIFKGFGYSELGARIPSLLFGLGCAALVYAFLLHLAVRAEAAAALALALVTCTGFYGFHAMTSADVDPALVFFNTVAFILIYLIFIEGRVRWYPALGAALGLGFMTKSLVGLLPAGLVPIAFALHPDRRGLALRPALLAGVFFLAPILPWLIQRQTCCGDNYLSLMLTTDILRRYQTTVEQHYGDFSFYARFALSHLGIWAYAGLAAALGVGIGLLRKDRDGRADRFWTRSRKAGAFCVLAILFYYLAFSLSHSKLKWYMLPSYPILFALMGIGFGKLQRHRASLLLLAFMAAMVVTNAFALADYERSRRTGVPIVDYVLHPSQKILEHRKIAAQGDLRQNGFVLARIYSDLQVATYPDSLAPDSILVRSPDAEYLIVTGAQRYLTDPRFQSVRLVRRGATGRIDGLFRIRRR